MFRLSLLLWLIALVDSAAMVSGAILVLSTTSGLLGYIHRRFRLEIMRREAA
jgi:hypothetical protein